MSRWISLPTEILVNIIHQFETTPVKIREALTDKKIPIHTTDLLQLQLTCKSWSSVTRSIIYRSVVFKHVSRLKNVSRLEKFMITLSNSDTGVLIENLHIDFSLVRLSFVSTIAQNCPNLKILHIRYPLIGRIWETIKTERDRGFLTKLEVIPVLHPLAEVEFIVAKYNLAAFQLRQSLRELVIYDMGVALYAGKLLCFPKVDTLCLKLTKYTNIYTIDQQIKNNLSMKFVRIRYENDTSNVIANNTNSDALIHASSQVKRLEITSSVYNYRLYTYIMQTFPNLETIFLDYRISGSYTSLLSTTEAVPFFQYLMNMREISANFYFYGKRNDIMLQLYDKNNTIRHLHLQYNPLLSSRDGSVSLKMSTAALIKGKIRIDLAFPKDALLSLPRIGFVEKSGFNLLCLEIDLTLRDNDVELAPSQENLNEFDQNRYSTLSKILHYCPQLCDLLITSTPLNDFGDGIQLDQKKRVYQKVIFERVTFGPFFLPGFSHHVSYISDMRIIECSLVDKCQSSNILNGVNNTYIDIHMPDTKFGDITCSNYAFLKRIYLTLLKTGEDQHTCYYGDKDSLKKIPLFFEPPSSTNDDPILCISIKCIDVCKITINIGKVRYHLAF
ncbi:hypothetical protein MFLAVUS_007690 [Mucor flavus]|uniref:F-box domain-containing protein n=1 Tax=Mucor flavus TaxID=439312 RepID=A0ABP9Z560_9FUNG